MRSKKGNTGIMNGRNARVRSPQALGVLSRNRSLNIFRVSLLVPFVLSVLGFGALGIAKAKQARLHGVERGVLRPRVVSNGGRPFTETWDEIVSRDGRRREVEFANRQTASTVNAGGPVAESALTIGTDFKAISRSDQVSELSQSAWPPAPVGAVGPDHFIEMVNQSVAIYTKTGARLSHVRLRDFLSVTDGANTYQATFDPRVIFDRRSGRFIAAVTSSAPAGQNDGVNLAVSRTTDPTGTWDKYHLSVGEPNFAVTGTVTLGTDDNGVYFGVTIFPQSGNSFSKIIATPKAPLVAGSPSLGTLFQFSNLNDSVSSPQPSINFDAVGPNDPEFFVSSSPSTNANINYRSLTWNGGSPSLSSAASISTPAYAQPVNAPASGSVAINLTDDRLLTAVVRGGSLWTARHVGLNAGGGSASADRTGCEWFQLGVSGTTLGVTQTGRVFDSGNNPLFYYFPSIVVNGQGHAVMGFSGSNASQFISAYFTGRFSGDPAGTMGPVGLLKAGLASYELLVGNNTNPWGRISAALLDPNDDMTMWTLQAYAETHINQSASNSNSNWGTWVSQLRSGPPATPANGASVAQGQASAAAQINGTSNAGSGFYDPVPNPPSPHTPFNHLSAVVNGANAPTVNGVTFTDATHITLNLNTTNAALGDYTVTITNPDGQSVTSGAGAANGGVTITSATTSTPTPTPTPNTSTGSNVTVQTSDAAVTFPTVTQAGTTTFTPINPTSAGTPPSGYTLCPTCAAYDITTTATFTPPVNVCLAVPSSLDAQTFLSLALLHGENGVLVDRTTGRFTASNGDRTVCGSVSSLSPFALAQGSAATPTPTPTPTPCSETITYTVNEVNVTIAGDDFTFHGGSDSITLTSGIARDESFENGLFFKPNQSTTPTGEYSANITFNVTFEGSVSTTLSRVVKYSVTPTQRFISFETGDAKTVDLGAKGKLDVTIAPRLVASIPNNSTAILIVPSRTDEATFLLHDACTTPNTVQFSAATYDADEGAATLSANGIGSGEMSEAVAAQAASTGMAVVQVTRAGDLSSPAEIDYATLSGTALDRTDFTAAYGTLRFAAGESSKSLVILITDDAYQEGQESFFVTLSNPVGVALGTTSTATVRINSDDASTGGSPVEDASFDPDRFVRYHYADFLNRLPDAGGLAFWKGQFDECVQRPAAEQRGCREVKRVRVSAAFFLSVEFQETGYLVYRLHHAAFGTGEQLKLLRFLNDTQEIRQGIIVGQDNWEQQLEANKQLFAERFVGRAEFLAIYPLTMSAQQFVDALNANTGGSLSQAERDSVVSQLAAAGNTTQARAQALRSIADDADFRAREMTRAFVLMQYFGYLRRNPPDAPDLGQDYGGYNFWLTKLNQFNGNFIRAEMVKAFLSSDEYRKRFGQ